MRTRWRNFKPLDLVRAHTIDYPMPSNLRYLWVFGFLAAICLVIQLITGIFLAMHYACHVDYAFIRVEHIIRDVNYGWLLRYAHANGASIFFIVVYIHIFRGLYYGSYMKPRQHLWASGVTLYILICAAAFFGYVLPWGQISYWAATVIFNLLSTVPLIGDQLVLWIWGGFSVDNATLNRIFSLHYLIPFLIAGLVVVHLALLHKDGNGNPLGIDARTDKVPFVYYAVQAKYPFPLVLLALFFSFFLFFYPNFLGHTDNYIPANPLSTPAHIVPEWYFLPFYAILRSIPSKSGGAAAFAAAIAIWYTLPFFQSSEVQRSVFRPLYRIIFWLFTSNFILLIWLGQQVAEEPFLTIGQVATVFYFSFFLVIIPGLGYVEQYLIRYSD